MSMLLKETSLRGLCQSRMYEIRGPSDSVGWDVGGGLGEEIIGMVVDCGDILEEQPLLVRTISFLIRAY